MSALALHSATHNLTKVIGPSLGGVLLTLIGPGPCLLIQALTICFMLVALFKMRPPPSSVMATTGDWFKDIAEGVLYLRQNRRVFATILTTYSNGFFGISYAQFLPYFAQEVLQVGPSGYGLLVSAPGVGAVLISFFLSTHTRLSGMRKMLVGASLIYAAAIFLFAISSFLALSIALLAVIGSMQMSYRVLARAIIQEGMSAASVGPCHEPVFPRSRLRLAWRPLHRQHRGIGAGSIGGRRQCGHLWIGFMAGTEGGKRQKNFSLIDSEFLI